MVPGSSVPSSPIERIAMKAVVQRVKRCAVTVGGMEMARIDEGLLVLLGIAQDDADKDLEYVADKVMHLRIFPDAEGKMNLGVLETGGAVIVVSQFTLLAEVRKGRRPSFVKAAPPEAAEPMYEAFSDRLRAAGLEVGTGVFGEMMMVSLDNWGPVTIIVDSSDMSG